MTRQKIHAPDAPEAIGTYSHAIQHGKTVYFSGQIPLDPATMNIVSEDFEKQARQVFANLQAVSATAGMSMNHIVKLTIYVTDISRAPTINEIMSTCFAEPYPARTTIQVSALPKNAQIEIDAIGVLD